MSPFVTETNFTWWPRAAHFAATPPPKISQSSGWAPKAMIRIFPSCDGGTVGGSESDWTFIVFIEVLLSGCVVAAPGTTMAAPSAAARNSAAGTILVFRMAHLPFEDP